jgi:hypothetical protein
MKDAAVVRSGRMFVGLRHDLDTVCGLSARALLLLWGLKVFPETLLN